VGPSLVPDPSPPDIFDQGFGTGPAPSEFATPLSLDFHPPSGPSLGYLRDFAGRESSAATACGVFAEATSIRGLRFEVFASGSSPAPCPESTSSHPAEGGFPNTS